MPLFTGRQTIVNDEDQYSEILEEREVDRIEHYETFLINKQGFDLNYGSYEHVWKKGDRLFKLAHNFYGDTDYWFLIALWNNKPTDAHFKVGDVIEIPFPPEKIYRDIVS